MNPLSPFLLQAQITPPGVGAFGLSDTTRLENPFNAPMWLDEIRFRLPNDSSDSSRTVNPDSGYSWDRIRVELKLGDIPLTNGYIPIGLFGKALADGPLTGGDLGPLENNPALFTWKLPKPLFIPAKSLLRPTLYIDLGGTTTPVTVIYVCRPLPRGTPEPKVLQVPWVTYYRPVYLANKTVDRSDQSTPSDLFNPFDKPLHVQRFVGRFMSGDGAGTSSEANEHMEIASENINFTTGLLTSGTMISAQDSMNNILIRDPSPFTHVFNQLDRSWTVNCILPPKGFYLFTIDRLWTDDPNVSTVTASVGISMVGWREVSLQ